MNTNEFDKKELYKLKENFDYSKNVGKDDVLYADFSKARKSFSQGLLMDLGLEYENNKLKIIDTEQPSLSKPLLVCGHRGCGKSTELRALAQNITESQIDYLPIMINVEQDLNLNNIEFSDIFILILEKIHQYLQENPAIKIDNILIGQLYNLLADTTKTEENKNSYDISAGIDVNFFVKLRAGFKNHASTTTTIRTNIVTKFSELAQQFNTLVTAIQSQSKKTLLFIVDGTDKLNLEASEAIFLETASLITQLKSMFIYAAPISLPLGNNQTNIYYKVHRLPMIKVCENAQNAQSNIPYEENYQLLRDFAFKRLAEKWFENPELVNRLIANSGGNPRHLLMLLENAWHFSYFDNKLIDLDCIKKAQKEFLNNQFYNLDTVYLETIDKIYKNTNLLDDTVKILLVNLFVLEYNGDEYWRYPHPALKHSKSSLSIK